MSDLAGDMTIALSIAILIGMRYRGATSADENAKLDGVTESLFQRCQALEHGYPDLRREIRRVFALEKGTN